jgi:hypothetical protein
LVPSAPTRAQSLEYPIKAAFLFKFGEFVQWPADAFEVSGGAINICIVGDSGFAAIVGMAVKNETVAGRKVAAHPLASIAASDPCHIAYIGGSEKQSVAEALQAVAGRPVLTVTDESKGPAPGVIHFVIRNNRVRFAINDKTAAANGLTLSSALLNIAVNVTRRD